MDPLEALVLQVLDQLEWQHPWAFVLLPLPIVMALLPPYRERRDAVRVPFFQRLLVATEARAQRGAMLLIRRRGQKVLIALMWLALSTGFLLTFCCRNCNVLASIVICSA